MQDTLNKPISTRAIKTGFVAVIAILGCVALYLTNDAKSGYSNSVAHELMQASQGMQGKDYEVTVSRNATWYRERVFTESFIYVFAFAALQLMFHLFSNRSSQSKPRFCSIAVLHFTFAVLGFAKFSNWNGVSSKLLCSLSSLYIVASLVAMGFSIVKVYGAKSQPVLN